MTYDDICKMEHDQEAAYGIPAMSVRTIIDLYNKNYVYPYSVRVRLGANGKEDTFFLVEEADKETKVWRITSPSTKRGTYVSEVLEYIRGKRGHSTLYVYAAPEDHYLQDVLSRAGFVRQAGEFLSGNTAVGNVEVQEWLLRLSDGSTTTDTNIAKAASGWGIYDDDDYTRSGSLS